jgi:S-formylglutathione hydrolase FrmB
VAGLSSGGTCAMQTTVRAPQTYPSFAAYSGEDGPTLATHDKTLHDAFDGSEAAYKKINPLDELAAGKKLPVGTAAFLTVGEHDWAYRPQVDRVAQAFRAAGVPVQQEVVPGRHNWPVFGAGLERSLPWLATRFELA